MILSRVFQDKYLKNGKCLGGGDLKVDEKNKEVVLSGCSKVYGEVSNKYKEVMKNMLKKQYPELLFVFFSLYLFYFLL